MSDLAAYLDEMLPKIRFEKYIEEPRIAAYDLEVEVCTLLREQRKALGLTQKELSVRSGVSQANISKFERGNYHVSLQTLQKLATGLSARVVVKLMIEGEL